MKKILTLLMLLAASQVWAQTDFCGTGKFAIKRFYSNDTVTIACDTAYLFNKATYGLYKRLYMTSGTQDQKVKALLLSYDYMKNLYENRINEQDEEYKQLRVRFDSLVVNSETFIKSSSVQLTEVKNSITVANDNIVTAQNSLKSAEEKLNAGMRASNKRLLTWSLGGFVLGVATTTILFLAMN